MDINYNILSFIEILGVLQGLVLGLLLLIISLKKQKPAIFLGLFIVAFSLHFLPIILEDLQLTKHYPKLRLLPVNAVWIGIPLFFIYVQKISIFSNEKILYRILYPGIFASIVQLIIFLLPIKIKLEIKNSSYLNLFLLFGILYTFCIVLYTLNFIRRHNKEVKNQYSSTEHKKLNWAALFLICFCIPTILVIRSHFFEPSYSLRILTACISVSLLYWVSIKGGRQINVLPVISKNNNPNEAQAGISEEVLQNIVTQTNKHIILSRIYKNKELTIVDVAESLKVHPRRISTAINKICEQNFNSYINQFRIDEAIKLILKLDTNNLSMEGIGSEVGFHSKSAFYSAFKKITNTTPTEYKNQHSKA